MGFRSFSPDFTRRRFSSCAGKRVGRTFFTDRPPDFSEQILAPWTISVPAYPTCQTFRLQSRKYLQCFPRDGVPRPFTPPTGTTGAVLPRGFPLDDSLIHDAAQWGHVPLATSSFPIPHSSAVILVEPLLTLGPSASRVVSATDSTIVDKNLPGSPTNFDTVSQRQGPHQPYAACDELRKVVAKKRMALFYTITVSAAPPSCPFSRAATPDWVTHRPVGGNAAPSGLVLTHC